MRLIYPVAALVGILALSACSTDRNAHHAKKHNRDAQNYSLTYEQVREAAQDGDADAQYALGYMYYYGQNVTRNSNQARFWIRKAAAQNHQQATKALKMMGSADNTVASGDSAQTAPARNLASRQNTWQEVRRPRDAAVESEQLGRQDRGTVAQAEQFGRPGQGAAAQSAQIESPDQAQVANAGSPRQYRQSFKLNNSGPGAQQANAADTEDTADNHSGARHAKHQAAHNLAGHKSAVADADETTIKKPHLTAKERRLAKKNNALHGKNLAKGGSRANHNKYATSKLHHDTQAATLADNESTETADSTTVTSDEANTQSPVANQTKSKGRNAKASRNQASASAADETDNLANAEADETPSASNTANTSEDESSSETKQPTQKAAQLSKGAKVALNHAGSSKAQKAAQARNAKPFQVAEHNAHNKFALSGSNKPSHDEHHIMSQPNTHYTLQLIGGSSKANIQQVIDRNHLQQKAKIYHTNLNGKDFYVLIYGTYPTQAAAAAEISRLPASLQQLKPWVKPYSAVKAGIKAAAAEGSSQRTR